MMSQLSLPPLLGTRADAAGDKPDEPVWGPPSSGTVSSEQTLVPNMFFQRIPWTCIWRNAAVGSHSRHPAFLLPGELWVNGSLVNWVSVPSNLRDHFRVVPSSGLGVFGWQHFLPNLSHSIFCKGRWWAVKKLLTAPGEHTAYRNPSFK